MQVGDLATWVTGVATIALFLGALWQIGTERKARQIRELEVGERIKRDQAMHVSAWISREKDNRVWITISNKSMRPVYEVIASLVMFQGGGPRDGIDTLSDRRALLSVAPPGEILVHFPADYHGMHRHPSVELGFKDGAGNNWVRKGNGDLIEIQDAPVEHYKLSRPLSWRLPT